MDRWIEIEMWKYVVGRKTPFWLKPGFSEVTDFPRSPHSCMFYLSQVLEVLWELAHLPTLPTTLVQQALEEHLTILSDAYAVKETVKKSYIIKCIEDIKKVRCQTAMFCFFSTCRALLASYYIKSFSGSCWHDSLNQLNHLKAIEKVFTVFFFFTKISAYFVLFVCCMLPFAFLLACCWWTWMKKREVSRSFRHVLNFLFPALLYLIYIFRGNNGRMQARTRSPAQRLIFCSELRAILRAEPSVQRRHAISDARQIFGSSLAFPHTRSHICTLLPAPILCFRLNSRVIGFLHNWGILKSLKLLAELTECNCSLCL